MSPRPSPPPVAKRWIGEEGGPITVHLLADGTDTGKTLTLDKDGNWTSSFTELAKYSAGREISYTISEDAVDGYTSQITGDATSGFTMTNTLVPKDTNPKTPKETKVTKVTRVSTGILPKTGDETSNLTTIAAVAASGIALAAGMRLRQRNEK